MSQPKASFSWEVAYGQIQLQLGSIAGETEGIKGRLDRIDTRQREMADVLSSLKAGGVIQPEPRNDKEMADQLVGAWLRGHYRKLVLVALVALVSVSVGLVSIDMGKARDVREAISTATGGRSP